MIRIIAAALLASASPLLAAEIAASSRIDAVVVHPGVATVTRIVDVEVQAGQHAIVVQGLPQALHPASLRVEGVSTGRLSIGSVEMRTRPLGGAADPQGEVAKRLRELKAERQKRQARLAALEAKQQMILKIAQEAPTLLSGRERSPGPSYWSSAWDSVGEGLVAAAEEVVEAQAALQALDEEIGALGRQAGVGLRHGISRSANISIEADGPARATLKLTYQVQGATWRPSYDAALVVGSAQAKPKLTLVRRAVVSQRTGEDWTDVALTVSTAQAAGGTAAPEVPPIRVAFNEISPVTQNAPAQRPRSMAPAGGAPEAMRAAPGADAAEAAMSPPPAPSPIVQAQAQAETAGFAVQFVVPGRATIAADGSTRSFRLGSSDIEPTLGVKAAPGLDPKAYLEARFTNGDEAPILAGEVSLTRDGVFVGQGRIGQVAQGDAAELGFGVDDRVKVARVPVRRREVEPSWVQGNRTDLREFKTTVKSLHDRPMRITVLDQTPFAENAAITVETLPNMTPPTDRNVQDRRGVAAWTYEYKPGEEREIRHGFRMRWPGDRELVLEPQRSQ